MKQLLRSTAFGLALCCGIAVGAFADTWPSRPVTLAGKITVD